MSEENRKAADLWERYRDAADIGTNPREAFVQVIGDALDELEAAIRDLEWRVRIAEYDTRGGR